MTPGMCLTYIDNDTNLIT